MNEETSSDEVIKKTENRGVNVTSDCFSAIYSTSPDKTSLVEVKHDVQTVIELMGPNTPHFNYNTSSEADNEESIFSSVSGLSSILHFKKFRKHTDAIDTSSETLEKIISLQSPPPTSKVQNDFGVNFENQQEELYYRSCSCPYNRVHSVPPPPSPPPQSVCVNPNCVCVHSMGYVQQMPFNFDRNLNRNKKVDGNKDSYFSKLFKKRKKDEAENKEFYKINIVQTNNDHSPTRRLVFDLVDGIPKPETNTVGINTVKSGVIVDSNSNKSFNNNNNAIKDSSSQFCNQFIIPHTITHSKNKINSKSVNYCKNEETTKVDIYYFDHGNYSYFRTTDSPPLIMTEILVEKTEHYTTKFWAEFFGTVHVGFAFFTAFFLQLFRFLLYGLIRPLTVGVVQLGSDYFFKPLLTVLFNAVIQPPLIFCYNIAVSLKDLCDPVAESIGYFLREIAIILRAIRIVEVKNGTQCNCELQKKKGSKSNRSDPSCCNRCIINSQ